jgi:5-formaminoimidazole-4-carboxamide-1-beta-D-ribofuranosyl 5'-monophosphate synthetase
VVSAALKGSRSVDNTEHLTLAGIAGASTITYLIEMSGGIVIQEISAIVHGVAALSMRIEMEAEVMTGGSDEITTVADGMKEAVVEAESAIPTIVVVLAHEVEEDVDDA